MTRKTPKIVEDGVTAWLPIFAIACNSAALTFMIWLMVRAGLESAQISVSRLDNAARKEALTRAWEDARLASEANQGCMQMTGVYLGARERCEFRWQQQKDRTAALAYHLERRERGVRVCSAQEMQNDPLASEKCVPLNAWLVPSLFPESEEP